jgi:hypothetical protein
MSLLPIPYFKEWFEYIKTPAMRQEFIIEVS